MTNHKSYHRNISNSQIHFPSGNTNNHGLINPSDQMDVLKLNSLDNPKMMFSKKESLNQKIFKKFELNDKYLLYNPIKAGTFCVAKYKKDFVDKYPFCEYRTWDEINQLYNSKEFANLEEHLKKFQYTKDGEFQLVDKTILDSQRGVIADVIKQATMSLIKGKGLMRVSMPIRLFEPICSYELISKFTGCLDKLYEAIKAKPGIERMKNVMSWMMGGFIYAMAVRKPFNNIIGETMNAEYQDGTKIYAEHVNHDPPIEMVLLVNEDLKFRMHANFETVVGLGANEATILVKGVITIDIGEDRIYGQIAPAVNRGLLFGNLRVCASEAFYFYYPNFELKGLIKVGSSSCQDEIRGGIYWAPNDLPIKTKTFRESLFPNLKEKYLTKEKQVSQVSGRLFQAMSFDGKEYWNRNYKFHSIQISKRVLPSDWLYRDDILWLWRGNSDLSMKWKVQLEDVNREWRKQREAYKKANKKLFK